MNIPKIDVSDLKLKKKSKEFKQALQKFTDQDWRLNNLYKILNDEGQAIPFAMNDAQQNLWENLHSWNLICKSRQLGFCLDPSTKVLTAELRWVRIDSLQPGDKVISVDEFPPAGKGKSRKMRTGVVQGVVEVFRKAYRITFEDGREVVCTGQHPWLTRKTNNETGKTTSTVKWRSIENENESKLQIGTEVKYLTHPWEDTDTYEDGWFGGMLDGEGSISKSTHPPVINVSQRAGDVWDRVVKYLEDNRYNYRIELDEREAGDSSKLGSQAIYKACLNSSSDMFRLIGITRPSRFIQNRFWEGRELPRKNGGNWESWSKVVKIEEIGEQKLIDLQTSEGTYIAEGFVSHNTTFIALYMLDTCLFTPNIETAIICHSREDASKILRRKIRYPYEHLPEMFKKKVRLVKDSESELQFSNGSVISTGTSARSGTLQILHISEFAKVCAKYPEKAREIVTGSLETLAPGQELFIESTAEGQQGYFYDYVQEAIKTQQDKRRKKLNKQEFRLHFFPWWKKPSNRLEMEEEVVFPVRLQEYYEDLEAKENIQLDREQKFWYMNAEKRLGDDIYREHPSTIEEPFKVAIEGSYFVREFNRIRREKRICSVPIEDGFEVQTAWDLGVNDTTAIWFFQMIGKEIRLVDYYENDGEGLAFYRDVLWEKNYRYGKHLGPHDLAVRELGTGKTRLETAQNLGINFLLVPRTPSKSDAIQAARNILGQCWFDESRCLEGVQKLELYRKEWDERRGTWKNQPRHDENSHTADAFLTLAQGFDLVSKRKIVRPIKANSKKRWLAAVAG